jgi:hypothetical protein
VLERRTIPCTSYPFSKRNSARYDPSWPVTPVIKATFFETILNEWLKTKRGVKKYLTIMVAKVFKNKIISEWIVLCNKSMVEGSLNR